MNFLIKNKDLQCINRSKTFDFPKYTSQLINWANQNAQGTRPKMVGQLSELFPEYLANANDVSPAEWEEWYLQRYPEAIENASAKIYEQIENLKEAILFIDEELVRQWVEDLVISKTYNGLYVQKAILAKVAEIKGTNYRLADKNEEAAGIDGFVGKTAYSVKPESYKTMKRLSETISVKMIYYTKKKTGLNVDVEE